MMEFRLITSLTFSLISSLSNHIERIQRTLTTELPWLSTYGFELNNRELASLIWLGLAALLLLNSDIRSSVVSALKFALTPKLAITWATYTIWIIFFIYITDTIGIWRVVLTKDTLVWSGTAGIVLLLEVPKAMRSGYFRQAILKVAGVSVIIEYIMNMFVLPFLVVEWILQHILFLVLVAPIVVSEPEGVKRMRRIRFHALATISATILIYTVITLYVSWQTLDLEFIILKAAWPILLGLWVLVFVFILSIIARYDEARVRRRSSSR